MLLTALTKSPYFKDNPASMELCPPNQELQWVFFLCTQSAVSTEESASSTHNEARASASWLPRGVSACEPWCERPWGWPQAPAGEPRCFTTYPDPRRAYSWSSTFQLPTVQDTGSIPFSSVQFSHSVMSDSLWPHEPQHTRPPCPSPTPGVHPNPCPLSQWCHPTISSSVIPFSSCPQSLPASGSSQMSQLFAWGDQSIGFSASTSVLPMNTQDWSPLEWTGWISLQSKGLSRVFSNTTVQKHQFFSAQLSL